jgi:ubiquinone/menaquinone biosynthesis C-methylase UbiE
MIDRNQETYQTSSIVWHYTQLNQLQPAERTILELLRDRLPTMKMLDIGIGGGRTTQHFSPLAGEYTGIDYSPQMIAACQQRFTQTPQTMALEVGDARNMPQFADNSFDFILFSFNGIDYMSVSDRLKILSEVARVGKTGCYFYFSSHNLQGMAAEFNWRTKFSFNPLKTYVNLVMLGLLNIFNLKITHEQLETADYLIIKDESHNFRLQTYYIRPQAQIQQLRSSFEEIEIYSWQTGLEIVNSKELSTNIDMWLYYLCIIK